MPCTATKSRASRYCTSWKPRPFHSNVVSVSTAPPSSRAICRPMTVMIGISAGLYAWCRTRRNSLDAARAGRVDVRLAERADHVGAHQPQEDAGGEQAERDRRQHRVGEHVADDRAVAEPDRVDQVDAGRGVEAVERDLVAGAGTPVDAGSQCSPTAKISLSTRPAKNTGVA